MTYEITNQHRVHVYDDYPNPILPEKRLHHCTHSKYTPEKSDVWLRVPKNRSMNSFK